MKVHFCSTNLIITSSSPRCVFQPLSPTLTICYHPPFLTGFSLFAPKTRSPCSEVMSLARPPDDVRAAETLGEAESCRPQQSRKKGRKTRRSETATTGRELRPGLRRVSGSQGKHDVRRRQRQPNTNKKARDELCSSSVKAEERLT